jgi:hypothetical protein
MKPSRNTVVEGRPARTAPDSREDEAEEGTIMKKFGIATLVASGLTAGFVGLAAPAQAAAPTALPSTTFATGVDHLDWINNIQPSVNVPKVDTGVRHSGR